MRVALLDYIVRFQGCIFAMLAAAGCASADPMEDQLPAAFTPGRASDPVHMVKMSTPVKIAAAYGEPVDNCAPWRVNPVADSTHAFDGTEPYKIHEVILRANEQHALPVAGKDCLTCHNGSTRAPRFDFAGTIYTSIYGTAPAANTEVRVVRPDGYYATVHADADGNFWHKGNEIAPRGSQTGVRNAGTQFIGHLNGAACNSCHVSGNRLYIK